MTTATRVEDITPITNVTAESIAATEYTRVVEQLRELARDEWTRPTDCPAWDVRAMAGHTLGMMSDFTSLRSVMHRMRVARKRAKATNSRMIDAMTAGQVEEHATLTTDDVIARMEATGPRAAHWRTHAPSLFRMMPLKEEVGGQRETWRMSYLLDTILTRDPWMHRVDIAHATGHMLVLTPEHDGAIVADVVAEWARRHGAPFTLTLTGPAGGEFVASDGGEPITLDAIEFCRTISGRATGHGLLTQEVPF